MKERKEEEEEEEEEKEGKGKSREKATEKHGMSVIMFDLPSG